MYLDIELPAEYEPTNERYDALKEKEIIKCRLAMKSHRNDCKWGEWKIL